MIVPTAFRNCFQLAWITNDIERSIAQFQNFYSVPSFFTMEQEFAATVRGETGVMKMRVALANVDDIQLEIIQPCGGIDAIYREVLPADGTHANVFHHICTKVNGTQADWDAYLRSLGPERPICYQGDIGKGGAFCFTDERATLGLYMEHLWLGEEADAMMARLVPTYRSPDYRKR